MKKLTILLCCFLLWACSDPVQLTPSAGNLSKSGDVVTTGLGLPGAYEWTSLSLPDPASYAVNDPTTYKDFIQVNGNVYWFVGTLSEFPYKLNKHTLQWELQDFDGIGNPFYGGYHFLFSKGTRYYVGFRGNLYGDGRIIYWYDVATGTNGQIAEFPGTLTDGSNFFVAGEKAYIVGGQKGNLVSNQYWEYDFATNQWTDKGGLPGGARAYGVVQVIDNRVYYGLGYSGSYLNGQFTKQYKNDWYMMNPGGTVAAVRADFPGIKRTEGEGFTINSKAYLGWGRSAAGTYLTDFWEFNPATNTWTSKPNCPSAQTGSRNMHAFALGDNGYFIRGCLGAFWRYSNTTLVATP